MSKKATPAQTLTVAGLGERDVANAQKSVPSTYFGGIRRLPVSWMMEPVNQFSVAANQGKGGK